ncbi:MAG: ATP-dependent Clp protease proteolytic subunit [Clostridia bacterium]|nr:ATP-dependent Clp protease proteolytic subunit [Clostridia bacterium]
MKNGDFLKETTSEKSSSAAGSDKDGTAKAKTIRSLSIIGQVEGHTSLSEGQKGTKYEEVLPSLVAFEEDDAVGGLLVLLNTVGGDVEAGLCMAEMIASLKKPTVSLVLGGGHSIGVPLAVSARRSFIVPSATLTLHPVRINGTVIGAEQTYQYLEGVQNHINRFILTHSAIGEARLRELMTAPDKLSSDIGTVLDGYEAVREGLLGEIGGLREAMTALRTMIDAE